MGAAPSSVPFTKGLMNAIHAGLMNSKSNHLTILSMDNKSHGDYNDEFTSKDLNDASSIGVGIDIFARPFISIVATVHYTNGTTKKSGQTFFQRYTDDKEFWTNAAFNRGFQKKEGVLRFSEDDQFFFGGGSSIAGRCDARPLFIKELLCKGVAYPQKEYASEYKFNDDSQMNEDDPGRVLIVDYVTLDYPVGDFDC